MTDTNLDASAPAVPDSLNGRADVIVGSVHSGLCESIAEVERLHALLPKMLEQGGGSIINVTSAVGRLAGRGFAAYGTAKAALAHYTKLAAMDLCPKIRVNGIAPGSILTSALDIVASNDAFREPMEKATPLRRLGDPQDIAAAAVKREAALAADVDKWIAEGRVRREKRDEYIAKHRNGKAAAIVRNIPAGAWTAGQRLAGGAVGTPVDDLPAKPETEVKRQAKALVAQARSMDRSGYVVSAAPAAQQDTAVKSEAKRLIEQARGVRG